MLETKPILDPNNKIDFTKKNITKTDEKPTTTSVSAGNDKNSTKTHVIELSCDVYNNVLSSTESQTLARSVSRKKIVCFFSDFHRPSQKTCETK